MQGCHKAQREGKFLLRNLKITGIKFEAFQVEEGSPFCCKEHITE